MRYSQLSFLFVFFLSLALLAGCGSDSGGPAKPAADVSEMEQWLADNPDQDVEDPDGDFAVGDESDEGDEDLAEE